jgi:hypothetical protein
MPPYLASVRVLGHPADIHYAETDGRLVSSVTGLAQLPTLWGMVERHVSKADCRTLIGPAKVGIHQGPAVVGFRHVRALLSNRRQTDDR